MTLRTISLLAALAASSAFAPAPSLGWAAPSLRSTDAAISRTRMSGGTTVRSHP